jgi:hypothetical protein
MSFATLLPGLLGELNDFSDKFVATMAPRFDIHSELPHLRIFTCSKAENSRIEWTKPPRVVVATSFGTPLDEVRHEASHFLHREINPRIFDEPYRILRGLDVLCMPSYYAIEVVAQYGAILHASIQGDMERMHKRDRTRKDYPFYQPVWNLFFDDDSLLPGISHLDGKSFVTKFHHVIKQMGCETL